MPGFDDVEKVREQLSEVTRQYWTAHNLFTWQWWLLIVLSIVPWLVWWKLVNKQRMIEIALFGAFVALLASILDVIGTNVLFWGYPQQPLWFLIPPLLPIDLTIMPVEHMLLYEYFPRWKGFILALIVVAVISAFLLEPLFSLCGLYKLYSWQYAYSVPIYILKALLAKLIIQKMLQRQMSK